MNKNLFISRNLHLINTIVIIASSCNIDTIYAQESCPPPHMKAPSKSVTHEFHTKNTPNTNEKINLTNINIISPPRNNCYSTAPIIKSEAEEKISYLKKIEVFVELLVKILSALAWPIVVLIIAMSFKSQITQLLSRLRKGSIAGAEFIFDAVLEKYETSEEDSYENEKSAAIDPRGTIISSWLNVENGLVNLLESIPRAVSISNERLSMRYSNSSEVTKILIRMGVLTKDLVEKIQDLRRLRNIAAHSQDLDFPSDSVVKYSQIADEVVAKLKEIQANTSS